MIIAKSNTGVSNITRALFIRDGVLTTIFYEESGVVLCGDIYFQTTMPLIDDEYIGDDNIIDDSSNNAILYRVKFTNDNFNHIIKLMQSGITLKKMTNNASEKINLSSSLDYVTNKFHKRLASIVNELAPEDLEMLGLS